jgi:hypothetical protein
VVDSAKSLESFCRDIRIPSATLDMVLYCLQGLASVRAHDFCQFISKLTVEAVLKVLFLGGSPQESQVKNFPWRVRLEQRRLTLWDNTPQIGFERDDVLYVFLRTFALSMSFHHLIDALALGRIELRFRRR